MSRFPVWVYHSVEGVPPNGEADPLYSVPLSAFRSHLGFLRAMGAETIPLGDITPGPLPARPVAITFDDGYEDSHSLVLPLLKEFGFCSSFFVIVGRVGRRGYMDWRQIRDLSGEGMEIGSHGLSHSPMTALTESALRRELVRSRALLEEKLGTPVRLLSLPRGAVNRRVLRVAFECGYLRVCTSRIGYSRLDGGDAVLKRFWIMRKTPLRELEGVFRRDAAVVARLKGGEILKILFRAAFGARAYGSLRRILRSLGLRHRGASR